MNDFVRRSVWLFFVSVILLAFGKGSDTNWHNKAPLVITNSKHSNLKIGIISLSVGTSNIPKKVYSAVHSKRCYAELHGYTFIINTDRKKHVRQAHWTRVLVLQKYLHMFDWILYLDMDTMIVNATIKLEDFLLSSYVKPDVNFILNEGDHINSGGFFIRGCEWSYKFLNDWWKAKAPHQMHYDQDALVFLLLDRLNADKDLKGKYDKSCHRGELGGTEKCWEINMERFALPLNKRFSTNIIWWPCNSSVRGFNFYGHGFPPRHYCQFYQNGDLLAHSRFLGEFDVGFSADSCPNPWTSWLHVELSIGTIHNNSILLRASSPDILAHNEQLFLNFMNVSKVDKHLFLQTFMAHFKTLASPSSSSSSVQSPALLPIQKKKSSAFWSFETQKKKQKVVYAYWFSGKPFVYVIIDLSDNPKRLEGFFTFRDFNFSIQIQQTWHLYYDGNTSARKPILRQK